MRDGEGRAEATYGIELIDGGFINQKPIVSKYFIPEKQ
jgi:hypothetical protein